MTADNEVARKLAASVDAWLEGFNAALERGAIDAAAASFAEDGHWRDILATGWRFGNWQGRADIGAGLAQAHRRCRMRNFRIAAGRTAPRAVTRAGRRAVEAILAFETDLGRCDGVLRLVSDPTGLGGLKAWIFLTALSEIPGHEERIGARRTGGEAFARNWGGENWLDGRRNETAFVDRDPDVLVVGAGQAGLSIAARLKALDVDTLVIEKHAEIGDNWRRRYHSLVLHNEVDVNHLPYIPFPPTCPVYIPKDKLASWFSTYAENMDLNVWTGTELVAGSYDETAARWAIEVRRGDGAARTLRPRHMVFATGVSGIPIYPDVPGIKTFAGDVVHSGRYADGRGWAGKRAVVLGSGNSGHDVAQDLHACGAKVTMIQRGPTTVVSLAQAQRVYDLYAEGAPLADCDLLTTAMPYPVLVKGYQLLTADMAEKDGALLDRLGAKGFRVDFGHDNTGFQMKYLREGGGYYFNVGCSDLIADGEIELVQYSDVAGIEPEGVRLRDGRLIAAEVIALATGFKNLQDVVRVHLGDAIADRIGPVWGYGEDGELRNMFQPTPQPGLWFIGGSFAQCRIYSKYLGLQIKAAEAGLVRQAPNVPAFV